MSWLSELFGGSGGEDPRAVQQREQQRIDDENKRAQEAAAAQQMQFEALLKQQQDEAAQAAAERAAQTQKDDQRYADQQAAAQAATAPVPLSPLEEKQNAADEQDLADAMATKDLRKGATAQANQYFAPEFEQTWAPSTADDPYIEQAYGKERARADDYLNNLYKRKVITQTGLQGGEQALEDQAPGVRGQLSDVGQALIDARRGELTGLSDRAHKTAATLELGQTYDPSVYDKELHDTTADWGAGFGTKFAAAVPQNLFDTTQLSQKAGAAQGQQNLAFDPNAVAGDVNAFGDPTAEDPLKKKRQPVAVF